MNRAASFFIVGLSLMMVVTACNVEAPPPSTSSAGTVTPLPTPKAPAAPADVMGNEQSGPVGEIYGKNGEFAIFAGRHPNFPQAIVADGKLWAQDLKTGEIVQMQDTVQFGAQSFVMGAAIAPDQPSAYALVSSPDKEVGQREYLVKIDLRTGKHTVLSEDLALEVIDISGPSLVVSPDGKRLAFQGYSTVDNRALGVYEIQLPTASQVVNAQSVQQSARRVTVDTQGQGLMPHYTEDGQLKSEPVKPEEYTVQQTGLSGQAGTYDLRFPLSGDGFYVQRGYNTPDTHTSPSDRYALDLAREPRNISKDLCVGYDIYAAAAGTVYRVKKDGSPKGGYGNYVLIEHVINGQKVQTLYAHLQALPTQFVQGQTKVIPGTYIQEMGNSGYTGGFCHLHFAYRTHPGELAIKPATPAAPMQGLGPYAPGGNGSCPITSFDNANRNTFYRYYQC